MSWMQTFNISESLKKRACRYLLNRYLGEYLDEKLNLDQLSVNFCNGTGSVCNVSLDVQKINELCEQKHLPVEFVDGFISEISVSLPWSTLLKESVFVEVSGLQLTIQPKQRDSNGESMLQSMWSSMASSIQIATECLKQEPFLEDGKNIDVDSNMEGLEAFARGIESILSRVKIKFLDTTLRLEHLPKEGKNGIAVEVKIKKIEYCDETNCEDCSEKESEEDLTTPSFSIKKVHCEGISFYTDEFPVEKRTYSRSLLEETPPKQKKMDLQGNEETTSILIGKLSGVQEIRIKLKKLESQKMSPKVDIEFSLGFFSLFLSPRQLYLLFEVFHSLAAPHTQDTSNIKYKKPSTEKGINTNDYRKIEQDLNETLTFPTSENRMKNNPSVKGWSSTSVEESDEEFLPFGARSFCGSHISTDSNALWESNASTILSSKLDGLYSHSTSLANISSEKFEKGTGHYNLEICEELCAFHLSVSNVVITILHEDILTFGVDTYSLTPSSVCTMDNVSHCFFEQFEKNIERNFGTKDWEKTKDVIRNACNRDHIRILGSSIIIRGKDGGSGSSRFCSTNVSAANFEILELLFEDDSTDPQCVELLKFIKDSNSLPFLVNLPTTSQPVVRIHIEQKKKSKPSHVITKSEITVNIQHCWSEMDLSLYDRLSAILNIQSLCVTNQSPREYSKLSPFVEAVENSSVNDERIKIRIISPYFVIKFRFPIPDHSSFNSKNIRSWSKRSIRKDILFLSLEDVTFLTEINVLRNYQDYFLQSSKITALFQEGESDVAVPFLLAKCIFPHDFSGRNSEADMPKLSFRICPVKDMVDIEINNEKEENSGLSYSSYIESPAKESSPFKSKRFFYKNDNQHCSAREGEEIIIPAAKDDLDNFIKEAFDSCKFQMDIILPYVHLDLSSKHLYEVMYNRFNSDISLWQSANYKRSSQSETNYGNINDYVTYSSFSLCKSGLHIDSDIESDNGDDEEENFDFSKKTNFGQSHLGINMFVSSANMNMFTNVKDSSGGTFAEKHGQIHLILDKAHMFTVTNYKSLNQRNYFCFQIEKMSLLHKPIIITGAEGILRNAFFEKPPSYMNEILYKRPQGLVVQIPQNSRNTEGNMFTTIISTAMDKRKVKTVRIACSLNGVTLRHHPSSSEHSWFTQLMDFFDVVDYPIKGYDSPQVITELYLHLNDSAIDYRPIHLRTRCVIYFGSLSISSNIAAKTKTSTLRFIAEDGNIFISESTSKNSKEVHLKEDYVSVVELGLFELSLRLSEQPNLPRVDLRASSDVLHIRTCADSACSLAQLISYYASDGDLNSSKNETEKIPLPEPYLEKTISGKVDEITSEISESGTGDVYDIMEDAMKEITNSNFDLTESNEVKIDDEVKIFYFPDETGSNNEQAPTFDWASDGFDSDQDFCFLEQDDFSKHVPEEAHPDIKLLSERPIQIIENHFNISLDKTDLLHPPKFYPAPVYKYALSDITIIWEMFGGTDFSCKPNNKNIKFNLSDSPGRRKGSSCSDMEIFNVPGKLDDYKENICSTPTISPRKQKRKYKSQNWYEKGGAGRNHDILLELQLNKVRYKHDIYADRAQHSSRQVLLIHSFEIRDRLIDSQINKFLYQHTTESSPRQSNAYMLVIKAVHLRTDARRNNEETCLKISMLPLRFNIDQDSLQFLVDFVSQLSTFKPKGDEIVLLPATNEIDNDFEKIQTLKDNNLKESKLQAQSPIYIKNFVFSPEVNIRIDYVGKRVDLSHGSLAGLFMGLGQLNCLQIKLKRLTCKHGLLGMDRLLSYCVTEWTSDIKKTQLPSLIGGVGPMHALVQLVQGIRDLFWLPIEQYQKDGRIIRGLQRGANSFTTSTAMAFLELAGRIIQAVQSIAEAAFDMVSPGPSVRRLHGNRSKKQIRYSHPTDIREGMTNAFTLVKEGVGETMETLVRVASAEAEQKGAIGAVGGVLRQLPPTLVAPIIISSEATKNLIGGIKCQLAPDERREASCKWKSN